MPFAALPLACMPPFCLAFFLACVISLYALLSAAAGRLPARYTGLCGLLLLACWQSGHISRASIKESVDLLPDGLCFGSAQGTPRLVNLRMDALSHALTGGAITDADAFWQAVTGGELQPGNARVRAGDAPLICLKDGTAWSFAQRSIRADGALIRQITAVDATEEYRLSRELEAENRHLREMGKRLRQYGENVRALTREREILRAKARIHDGLGQALIASRRLLAAQAPMAEWAAAAALWRESIALLTGEDAREGREGDFAPLIKAARAIGVSIQWDGERPPAGSDAARVLRLMAHACLTNAVRHASATELYVAIRKAAGQWAFVCTNNGAVPRAPICEGGGLGALRRRAEALGGAMRVSHAPRFALTITLPAESEAPA